jgi:hypothetical protein
MSYAQFASIDASDFNTLVGGNPTTTSGTLNAVWATGGGAFGYGQTALANVTVGQTVAATGQWATLVANTASAATHQGSSITAVTAPVAGGTITFLSAIPTNLTTVSTNRLNAATQGSTGTPNTVTRGTTWSSALTFTHTATFANGDAARYFFNSGGQLKLTFAQPNGTSMANAYNSLANACGTLVISAPSSGTITVAGTSYTGFTKIGGSGTPSPYTTNTGYYALTTSNANVFLQTTGTPAGYTTSFINVLVKSNGTQGSNGDAGSVITIYTVWDEIPNGLTVTAGSAVTLTAQAPETTNIANSWGTITLAGSVSGS